MTEPLSPQRLDRLLPALRHVAEMVAKSGSLGREELQLLLVGIGLEDEWALDELERWVKVLATVRGMAEPSKRELAQRALMLRGIPEAAAMLAVSVVSGGERGEPMPPPSRLTASVASLDFGTLPSGQGATAEFEVQGGPGQIVVESDQVQVTPQRFEAGATRVRVEVRPIQSGVLWTKLRLVTSGATLEVPVLAQWQELALPLPSEPVVTVLPYQEEAVITTSALPPALALRGYFILPDLAEQGLIRRLGRGVIQQVLPLSDIQVLVIAYGGAALFDLRSGEALWEIDCPTIRGALSPDGALLSMGIGKVIHLWDMRTGQFLRPLKGYDWVASVAFSPDGRLLASGSQDAVRLWEAASGRELCRLEGHTDSIVSVAFSPDGRLLASGSFDKTVRLWEAASGRELCRLEGHTAYVNSVAFSPDGRTLVSGSDDKTVRLWEVASGQELRRLEGHAGSIESVAFSPDGHLLASGGDGTVRIWRLR